MCCNSLTRIAIPDSVTSIGSGAFSECESLTGIEISSGNPAFASVDGVMYNKAKTEILAVPCRMPQFDIPFGITRIGDEAFSGCQRLTDIVIPNSVTYIGDYAFYNCGGLINITIPGSVTSIGEDAFSGCDILTIYGEAGSCAEEYAGDNDISFLAELPAA